ncbi:hypothetical protein FIBSPDRAFT_745026 [Athelia psychrophila]|uniref:Ribosomal protein S6 n=1 Tax=Athelia psychrophila TaxID=1759441 RepID=A0A166HBJ4_9AGAM|nr:hypothetical protein FIBSPDRAFT_745026 [Fibularhizoctonia sp. CBS 109695]
MPFYQMLCITAHFNEYKHIKELVRQTASHVMNAGGAVRGINSWGTCRLPQRMKRHQQFYDRGDYWTMHFDTSPRTLKSLNTIMRSDPRVIRWTMLKLGERIEDVVKSAEMTTNRTPDVQAPSTSSAIIGSGMGKGFGMERYGAWSEGDAVAQGEQPRF